MATVLNSKLILSAICVAALATGCSRNESQPAPAPVAPQEDAKPQPQPAPQPAPKSEPAPEDSNKPQPVAPKQEEAPSKPQEEQQAQPPQAPVVEAPKTEQEQPAQPESKADDSKAESKPESQLETLAAKVEAASKKHGFPILVAQKLTLEDVVKGLDTLDQVMEKVQQFHSKSPAKEGEAPRLEPLFDYMVLSSKNESITEHREDLRVKFDTEEDVSRAVSMLKYEFLNCEQKASGEPKSAERFKGCKEFYRTRHIEAFRKARTELNAIRKELPQFEIKCGTNSNVPVETCAAGARTFRSVVGFVNKEVMGNIKSVTIMTRNLYRVLVPVAVSTDADGAHHMKLQYMANPSSVARELHAEALRALEQR